VAAWVKAEDIRKSVEWMMGTKRPPPFRSPETRFLAAYRAPRAMRRCQPTLFDDIHGKKPTAILMDFNRRFSKPRNAKSRS
jgi:hypothetical protein